MRRILCFCLLAFSLTQSLEIVSQDPLFDKIVSPNAKIELLYDQGVWLEGVQVLKDQRVIFSDVKANQLLVYEKGKGVNILLSPSHFQNGHTIASGKILAASHGKRGIEIFNDGKWELILSSYQGKKFNSPNDLVFDDEGGIYFSDPFFGIKNPKESYGGEIEQDGEYCYYYHLDSKRLKRLKTPLVHSPNGIAIDYQKQILYIADSELAYDPKNLKLKHQIVAYDIKSKGVLHNERIFAVIDDGFPDGIKVDLQGNVWSSSQNGIIVFDASGKILGKILLNEIVGNFAFSDDNQEIYIAAGKRLYRLDLGH